jgi:signal peptidase I
MRTLLLGLVLLVPVARWAVTRLTAVTVTGDSMAPTFADGDRVLVRRVPAHRLRAGDVVVVRLPGADGPRDRPWLIKRVAALPGDPVPAVVTPAVGDGPVPGGRLVVLSDNPAGAVDSRELGYLDAGLVLGRVVKQLA